MNKVERFLRENIEDYNNIEELIKVCAHNFHISKDKISKVFKDIAVFNKSNSFLKFKQEKNNNSEIIDASSLLSSLDIVAKIKEYLNNVVKDNYIDNDVLRDKFDISREKWKEVISLQIFEARIFSYKDARSGKRTIVWSSKKGIKVAKSTISMSRYEQD